MAMWPKTNNHCLTVKSFSSEKDVNHSALTGHQYSGSARNIRTTI